jgi:hypothetical protein
MKQKLFTLLLISSIAVKPSYGQYIPIVEEGKYWIYLNHFDGQPPMPVSGHAITLQGDTLVNSLSYKKVYWYKLSGWHNCPYPPCFQFHIPYQAESKVLIALMREDLVQKKIYNLPLTDFGFCSPAEHLLFDFSLAIGDTLNDCLYDFIGAHPENHESAGLVDSIHAEQRFGKNRNTLFTYGIPWYGGDPFYWQVLILEGVGLEYYGIIHQPLSYLVDFCEGGMGVCDLILSTPSIEPNQVPTLFPNPTDGMVQISGEMETLQSIRIYSAMGLFIAEFPNTGAIDIRNLEAGIYFVELISEKNERIVKKVVKANK